ncbi:ribonuclease T2 [Rhizobium sp. BK251]|nr:ribonuclease T2 [Rhizobium sp. BK251]
MRQWLGNLLAGLVGLTLLGGGASAQDAGGGGATRFILAASWQPAFCATNRQKAECRSQTEDRFDARNFSLHGLWPMRKDYCGIDAGIREADKEGQWESLPTVQISEGTRLELEKVMPGTQSSLDRHEWVKHGSCTGLSADDYFRLSVELLDELNGSAVQALFAANIGKPLDEATIKRAFDESFGKGGG